MAFGSLRPFATQQFCVDNLIEIRWWPTSQKLRNKLALVNSDSGTILNLTVHLPVGGEDAGL